MTVGPARSPSQPLWFRILWHDPVAPFSLHSNPPPQYYYDGFLKTKPGHKALGLIRSWPAPLAVCAPAPHSLCALPWFQLWSLWSHPRLFCNSPAWNAHCTLHHLTNSYSLFKAQCPFHQKVFPNSPRHLATPPLWSKDSLFKSLITPGWNDQFIHPAPISNHTTSSLPLT